MAKAIHCNEAQKTLDFDVGQCDFVARGDTEQEAMAEITNHLQTVHHWNEMYEQDLDRVRDNNVRDE